VVVAVGAPAAEVAAGARGVAGWGGEAHAVATGDDAVGLLAAAGADDTVLVKASNAARLWQVAERLLAEQATTDREAGLPA
jgi:UDP-N-acetylmuramoyl-tripeptide--D-alanyl-D-alanine ligase